MKNAFGITTPKPPVAMALDALHGMDKAARLDVMRVVLSEYDAATLESLSNEIGRIAHEKGRE